MNRSLSGATMLCVSILLHACGAPTPSASSPDEAWNERNAPGRFGAGSDVRYDSLPTTATADTLPWSDDYWATRHGGIGYRWQTLPRDLNYSNYLYAIPTLDTLATLDEQELALLSPAEKYDLLMGDSELSVTKRERQRTLASIDGDDVPNWYGICHGWAPASYMEPQAKRAVARALPDGRSLVFYPSDINALTTRFYGDYHHAGYNRMLGARCETDGSGRDPDVACRDTNPGAMHLAIIHQISTLKKPFIAELDQGSQIWNHPVYAFAFRYDNVRQFRPLQDVGLARFRAPGTEYLVDVTMTLHYVSESVPSVGPSTSVRRTRTLSYSLELDSAMRIIGGEWSNAIHPDFLWRIERHPVAGDVQKGIAYDAVQSLLTDAQ